jgi:hypothetical protein
MWRDRSGVEHEHEAGSTRPLATNALRDAGKLLAAVAPGVEQTILGAHTVSVGGATLAGLVTVYVVVPVLRGLGVGLEQVIRERLQELRPQPRAKCHGRRRIAGR